MPFTFSHPAIVLPFLGMRRKYMCASALIMGSMIPDFEYFIRMNLEGRFAHTLPGVFLFDLPASLAFLFLFHRIVKKPFIDNLPSCISTRLQKLREFDFVSYIRQHFIALVICLLIGIGSHLVWDGFTHQEYLIYDWMPILGKPVSVFWLPELPLYRYLQHISSLIGALVIVTVFYRMPVSNSENLIDMKFWVVFAVVFLTAFLIRSSFGLEYYGYTVTVVISSGLVGLIAASTFTYIKWNKT